MKKEKRITYMSLEGRDGWVFHRKKCEKIHGMVFSEYKDLLVEKDMVKEMGGHLFINDKEVYILLRHELVDTR